MSIQIPYISEKPLVNDILMFFSDCLSILVYSNLSFTEYQEAQDVLFPEMARIYKLNAHSFEPKTVKRLYTLIFSIPDKELKDKINSLLWKQNLKSLKSISFING